MEVSNLKEIKTIDELLEILKSNSINYDIDLILAANDFAKTKYSTQKRKSGDTLLQHCVAVAGYIAQLKLDTASIIAAILHDVVDKAEVTIDEIDSLFGTETAYLVDGISKVRGLSQSFSVETSSHEFMSLLLNSSDDIRIMLLRICEKLHNLLSIEFLTTEEQLNSAQKYKNIYAPLAEYLGLSEIQRVFQDESFKIISPENYDLVKSNIDELFEKDLNTIISIRKELIELIKKYKVEDFQISGRQKGIYSTYSKLKTKYSKGNEITLKSFTSLRDVFAFRIILDSVESCYVVLGLVHQNYEHRQGEFKDYISKPKENGYKSIHTIVDFNGQEVEIQIRTQEMHDYNEFGPASHIAYKLQREGQQVNMENLTWTKDLMSWKNDDKSKKDTFKINIFKNSTFCFTPNGLVVKLPKDASPLDFAYRIHTDVGKHYRGAIVNGKMVSMDYQLKTGDVVNILIDKKITPSTDWIKFAKSSSTQSRIRRQLKLVD